MTTKNPLGLHTTYPPTNETRADNALAVLNAYNTDGNDLETAIGDLLSDLRHLSEREELSFDRAVAMSQCHYEDEQHEGDESMCHKCGAAITRDSFGSWLDDTDGDCCPEDNEPHEPEDKEEEDEEESPEREDSKNTHDYYGEFDHGTTLYVATFGRLFKVVAVCPDQTTANGYMAEHPGASLITELPGSKIAILADANDTGIDRLPKGGK